MILIKMVWIIINEIGVFEDIKDFFINLKEELSQLKREIKTIINNAKKEYKVKKDIKNKAV